MNLSGIPAKFAAVWASLAAGSMIRSIPVSSADPNAASLDLGWPPNTAVPVGSGGSPPDVRDDNGIKNQVTAWLQWLQAGGSVAYDATFQTAIGGYPNGALIQSAVTPGVFFLSMADANTSNPDAGGANWTRLRTRLNGNTTFYISSTGSDSNSGLDAGHPWLTRQHAWNFVQDNYDINGFNVLFQISDTTYTDSLTAGGLFVGQRYASQITFSGTTSAGTILNPAASNCFLAIAGACFTVETMTLEGGWGVNAQQNSIIQLSGGIVFGACTQAHMQALGGQVVTSNNYAISGGGPSHWVADVNGQITASGVTITLSGTPNFSVVFANAITAGILIINGNTFAGTGATGTRFSATLNGVINTNTGNPNYLPGNAAGSTATGGQYA